MSFRLNIKSSTGQQVNSFYSLLLFLEMRHWRVVGRGEEGRRGRCSMLNIERICRVNDF